MSSDGTVAERIGYAQREAALWPRSSSPAHGDEVGDGLVLVEGPARLVRSPADEVTAGGVLEPNHHVAHRSVADVGHRSHHGDDGVAGGGDDFRGDAVDAEFQEGAGPGFAGRRAERDGRHGDQRHQRDGGQ